MFHWIASPVEPLNLTPQAPFGSHRLRGYADILPPTYAKNNRGSVRGGLAGAGTRSMKRKRTAAQKQARSERKRNSIIIFINGKQKRVPRPPTIEGLPVDEFIARNADPIWLHQNELWELM
jgi:hypothetical protein